jgi:lysylphosphatidylglycerol synthetase-like protein (DUF2156 family)
MSMTKREAAEVAATRTWPVRVNGLLLVLQAVGLAGVGAYEVWRVDWRRLAEDATGTTGLPELEQAAERAIITALIFGPPAVLALLAASGFLFMLRAGWLLAMIVQSLSLLACLLLYSAWTPYFVYPVMLYCILMALYLNSSAVRAAFQVRPRRRRSARVP